jgi:uncharacterized protein (TIGR03067 family)
MRNVVISLLVCLSANSYEDQTTIQGAWTVSEYDQNGTRVPADILRRMKVTIKADKISISPRVVFQYQPVFKSGRKDVEVRFSFEADKSDEATLKVKPDKGWIDLIWRGSRGETKATKGIFLLDGKTLTMCFALADKKRPKKLPAQPKGGLLRMVLKRAE